jgi:hypothetical protein
MVAFHLGRPSVAESQSGRRKSFFFEKKKQKAFGLFQVRALHHDPRHYVIAVRSICWRVSWFG